MEALYVNQYRPPDNPDPQYADFFNQQYGNYVKQLQEDIYVESDLPEAKLS